MKRFWLSWEETSEDWRPLTAPPTRAVLAWWRSGEGEGYSTLVALVEAENEDLAKSAVVISWPGRPNWRFCEERDFDWRPGSRFPIGDGWERERIEGRR